ncbi:nuclear pore complex protein Nup107 [Toxorhynchites rutilus septentrionalis]|uniref:nuclear pore complex protein Nup107 n=1 Tax=Toxorhynchites rutilus septentrionalis TaxID=329112 RepID=UPI002479EAFA|nr:nuclear pore complex protein Nup107 [Toxorhynchites rutilus septentrionalis]XP_055625158.1 nuclear pore complex protein Nup107 [Toxorhynchites rutilus septentrionalis]
MSQLERSLLLLDESVVKSKRGLLRSKDRVDFRSSQQQSFGDETTAMDFELSLTVGPQEMRSFLLDSQQQLGNLSASRLSFAGSQMSATGANVRNQVDDLFGQFLEVLQRRSSEAEVFETVEDLIETLDDALNGIEKVTSQAALGRERKMMAGESWLNVERDTWKLLFALYKDRMVFQQETMEMDDLLLINSERTIVEHLYAANANLREYQLIVDWLEQTALEQNRVQIGHFTDRTIAWENTLHQLQNVGLTAFGGTREIVKSLDPDAPARERRPLHDLDVEDQARLSRQIFQELRFGRIEEAQNLCEHCGQPWRAAILEGWRLHHDPNYEPIASTSGSALAPNMKQSIEGNPRRDLWKKFAWKMAENRNVDEYTRATIGVLCGHLDTILGVLGEHSWTDVLWGYLKVQIDIRVESEIRSHCVKSYLPMPEKYWNSKMSLEQIFEELEAHKNVRIKTTAKDVDRVIQKYIILDDIPELMRQIDDWLADGSFLLTAQMLRFLTHLVLFMRQIGKQCQEDIGDKVIKRYVECLIKHGDPQLVAFYSAALPADMQLLMFSNYLETLSETQARKRALEEAYNFGLDVPAITVYTVEKIRNREEETDEKPQEGDITPLDHAKISSLEWLVFYPDQRGELLWQTNALIRAYLAKRNVEAARKAFAMVPVDTIQQIINNYGSKDDLPQKEEVSIKEYLCHQTYLAAIDGYNDWVEYYYNMKPKPPQVVKSSNFTERVASDHREQSYRMDLERWHSQLQEQTTVTRDLLYNILLFPEKGWLVDPELVTPPEEESEWHNRAVQMENLRKLCIPDVVLLLHQIFTLSERYSESLQLADTISSEERQLYAVYSKHKLAEVMTKIAESSLALMNEKHDPFVGNEAKK